MTISRVVPLICALVVAMPAASQGQIQTHDEQPGTWDDFYSQCNCPPGYSVDPGVIDQMTCEAAGACQSTGFFVDRSGYLGIGNTDPLFPVDVTGQVNAKYGYFLRSDDYTIAFLTDFNPNTAVNDLRILNFDAGAIAFSTDTTPNSATIRMRVFSNGDVGIGLPYASTPSYKLHVAGAIGGTDFINTSTREAKTAIEAVPGSQTEQMLSELLAMQLTTFEYKKEYGGDGHRRLGFIAEDLPAAVQSGNGEGVNLYALLAYTVGALQAQQHEIEELRRLATDNEQLRSENSELQAEVSRLRRVTAGSILQTTRAARVTD